jgi:hypothetical protein
VVGMEVERGSREKIISILLKMWVTVPRELEGFRDDGLQMLRRLPRKEWIAVHWGMAHERKGDILDKLHKL